MFATCIGVSVVVVVVGGAVVVVVVNAGVFCAGDTVSGALFAGIFATVSSVRLMLLATTCASFPSPAFCNSTRKLLPLGPINNRLTVGVLRCFDGASVCPIIKLGASNLIWFDLMKLSAFGDNWLANRSES